ncbi:MAG TPA: DPP IV N-terminal domain-containing protein [Patescibacteria group bacterium]|nr:DPP IV N-terminal domain-containing protein [Patescibacteria group bacterium]
MLQRLIRVQIPLVVTLLAVLFAHLPAPAGAASHRRQPAGPGIPAGSPAENGGATGGVTGGVTAPVPVTEANYPLLAEWEHAKLYPRITSTELTPKWIDDGDRFWYSYRTGAGTSWYLVDPARSGRRFLFDTETIGEVISRATGKERDLPGVDPATVEVIENGTRARFTLGSARYEYDIGSGEAVFVDSIASRPETPVRSVSPDGAWFVFSRGNDLYIARTADPGATERRITTDGVPGYRWGGQEDDTDSGPGVYGYVEVQWSNDSRRFCILRSDAREVGDLWLIDELAEPRPTLTTFKCAMPGEPVYRHELWVYDCIPETLVRIDIERWPDQTLWDLFAPTVYWDGSGSRLYFIRRSRDHLSVDLCTADPFTGKSTVLIEERMTDMVYIKPITELPEHDGFLWWSMRDGWGHLYRYGTDGTLIARLTEGEFNVDEVVGVDEESGFVYFTANAREPGRNPYYRHLYRVRLDGTKLELLTPEDAEHKIAMSPSKRYFIDTYSRVDTPPVSVLRARNGKMVLELERCDITPLADAGWKPPEVFSAMAADGVTVLWGVMWKPFDFDPGRRYPIIVRTYPGKQGEYIPHAFTPWATEGILAQLGFIVVDFGNRGGTPERGFAYRSFGRGDLRDYPIPDKKAVVEELAGRHPFIDINRVGIFGGSSGGYCAATAMLTEPDFFKVGVAISGPHDGRIMYNIWHERYNGAHMIENEDGSISWEVPSETNIEIAGNLKGHLLIIHGSMDSVAYPAHSARLADALIRAGKRFDYFVIPGANHGYGERHQWRYLQRLTADYFAEYLIGDHRVNVDMYSVDPERP